MIVYDPADAAMAQRAPSRRSARSWTWPSGSAAPSPASTASAGSSGRWLPDQLGPDVMELTRRIKGALDPDGILNPGAAI